MKRLLSLYVLLISISAVSAQTVTLTFTGRDANNQHLPMDRVVIANATQGWQETIYWPDTTLIMQNSTGIADNAANVDFGLRQNNPNPFTGTTYATLQTMDAGEVILEMTDVNGRIVETQNFASLQPGNHQFRINVATAGIYFLTARQNGQASSIKMVNNGQGATNRIEYQNFVDTRNNNNNDNNNVETQNFASLQENNAKTNAKGVATHPFTLGDDMIYKGYVTVNGTEYQSQMIHQNQFVSETFVLNFNVSAQTGLPTVTTDAATNVSRHSATCGGNVTADGGYSVLARGVCWSTSPNPVFNDSHVACGDGMGAFTGQLIGLEANTTYYVRSYAVNSVGTAYGNQVSFTTTAASVDGQPCPGTPTVTDIDNNTYNTVQIGQQCWMKENLKTTHYSSGIPISLVGNSSPSTYEIAYCYFPNGQESNVSTYGYLYNWPAVMGNFTSSESNPSGVQGICPTGWHVPSDAEWTQLTDYVSSQNEYVCGSDSTYIAKALASPTGWSSTTEQCVPGNNPSSNNATGFSAVPAGMRGNFVYDCLGTSAYFWSATQISNDEAYFCELHYLGEFVVRYDDSKTNGYSVRCLRDEGGSSATLPAVTTTLVTSITQNSATSGGNVISNGGATVTIRGVCWSTSLNPTIADSHTTDGSGMGSFTSSMTNMTANTTYYVRAYAVNSAGTAYGSQKIFTTVDSSSFTCGTSRLTDYDNNTYNTVRIGSQCWMKENLKTTHYSDGTPIFLGSNSSNSNIPYRYCPDNDSSNVNSYGYLYNWKAVMGNSSSSEANPSGVQGICPTGWHVPSDAEWTQLTDYVSSVSEYACECFYFSIANALASTTGWQTCGGICAPGNNPSTNNATGFSAVPAGSCAGAYSGFGSEAYFWSATHGNNYGPYYRYLSCGPTVMWSTYPEFMGFSVRCLRD